MRTRPLSISLFALSFLALSLLAPAPAAATGLEQLKSFLASTKSIRGDFNQVVIPKSGRKAQQSAGNFAILRPGKFQWTYRKPYQQLLVSDGEKLWIYDPELQQATVRRLGQAIGSSPAALLAGDELDKSFVLSDAESANGLDFVSATPRGEDASFVRLRIGFRDKLPRVLQVEDNFGQVTTLQLDHLEVNVPLAAGEFRFTPPKGVDLVGE